MKASQRIYRTVDGEVVAEGDPRAAFLLAAEGGDVPEEYVKAAKAFLAESPADELADTADAGEDDAAEEKAAAKPANKAVKKSANK